MYQAGKIKTEHDREYVALHSDIRVLKIVKTIPSILLLHLRSPSLKGGTSQFVSTISTGESLIFEAPTPLFV